MQSRRVHILDCRPEHSSDLVPYMCAFTLRAHLSRDDFARFRELCRGLAPVVRSFEFQRIVELFEIDEARWWIIEMLHDQRLREHPWLKPALDVMAAHILEIESETIPQVSLDSRAAVRNWYSLSMTARSVSMRCRASLDLK